MSNNPMTPSEQIAYLQKMAAYYNNNGEDALMDDILKSVKQEKEAGRLTNEMIINMTMGISRFLSYEQREKLQALVKSITDEK
ncbi:MAG: hypothetical protein RR054_02400 [Clostridia bacterium]